MSLVLSEGVRFHRGGKSFQPVAHVYLRIVNDVFDKHTSVDCIVTSIMDGSHMDGSFHFEGLAFDVGVPESWYPRRGLVIRDEILRRVPRDKDGGHHYFEVVFGDKKHRRHFHCEVDLKWA